MALNQAHVYVGIDPGVSGGIAALGPGGDILLAVKMPATEAEVFRIIDDLSLQAFHSVDITLETGIYRVRAVLERVSSSPQMGVVSAFTFGKGVGGLRMALAAVQIPFDEVTPMRWQKALSCLSGGDKNITKRRATQLFPAHTITHAIADALLMAEYCRRFHLRLLHGEEENPAVRRKEESGKEADQGQSAGSSRAASAEGHGAPGHGRHRAGPTTRRALPPAVGNLSAGKRPPRRPRG